jgi:hypothetical protein
MTAGPGQCGGSRIHVFCDGLAASERSPTTQKMAGKSVADQTMEVLSIIYEILAKAGYDKKKAHSHQ